MTVDRRDMSISDIWGHTQGINLKPDLLSMFSPLAQTFSFQRASSNFEIHVECVRFSKKIFRPYRGESLWFTLSHEMVMRSSNSVFEMEPNAPFPQGNLSVTLTVIVRLSDVIATSEQFAI